ncbi:hypothetical protein AURDEDRAFT_160653 [Auricularia subglabra TFB-10046 SS5]|nr:hypothetical protein AURDEDRAFT_160653 [Auricularia subglabra TFB-10046 SS5]
MAFPSAVEPYDSSDDGNSAQSRGRPSPNLPPEVMFMVFSQTTRLRDHLAMMATSKAWFRVYAGLIYRTLRVDDRSIDMLNVLATRPDIAALVQSLLVSWEPNRVAERYGAGTVHWRTYRARSLILSSLGHMSNLETLVLGTLLLSYQHYGGSWPVSVHIFTKLTRLDIHLSEASFCWLKQLSALTHLRLKNANIHHIVDSILHSECRLQWVSGCDALLEGCVTRRLLVDRAVVVPLIPIRRPRGLVVTYPVLHMAEERELTAELLDLDFIQYPAELAEFHGIVSLRLRWTGYYTLQEVPAEKFYRSLSGFVDVTSLTFIGKTDFISGLDETEGAAYLEEAFRDAQRLETVVDSQGGTWIRDIATSTWRRNGIQQVETEWYEYEPIEV